MSNLKPCHMSKIYDFMSYVEKELRDYSDAGLKSYVEDSELSTYLFMGDLADEIKEFLKNVGI